MCRINQRIYSEILPLWNNLRMNFYRKTLLYYLVKCQTAIKIMSFIFKSFTSRNIIDIFDILWNILNNKLIIFKGTQLQCVKVRKLNARSLTRKFVKQIISTYITMNLNDVTVILNRKAI